MAERVDRVRLLYLYPSELTDRLVEAVLATGVPYFDLSLQHVSRPLLRRMRRWGDGDRFLSRIDRHPPGRTGRRVPLQLHRGLPGRDRGDHDQLLDFVAEAQLDWCGFFAFSPEDGTYAVDLDGQVPTELVAERLAELREPRTPSPRPDVTN